MRPAVAVTGVVILLAGCGAAPTATPSSTQALTPTDTPAATPSDASSVSPRDTPPATSDGTGSQTAAVGTPTQTCQPDPLTADLEIRFETETPVRVTITEHGSETPVLNRTYHENRTRVEYGEDAGVFEPATDYQVIIRTNDVVRWNRTVQRYMEYELVVRVDGSVEHLTGPVVVESPTPYC